MRLQRRGAADRRRARGARCGRRYGLPQRCGCGRSGRREQPRAASGAGGQQRTATKARGGKRGECYVATSARCLRGDVCTTSSATVRTLGRSKPGGDRQLLALPLAEMRAVREGAGAGSGTPAKACDSAACLCEHCVNAPTAKVTSGPAVVCLADTSRALYEL